MEYRPFSDFLEFVATDHAAAATDDADLSKRLRQAQHESVGKQAGAMILANAVGALMLAAAVLAPWNQAFIFAWLTLILSLTMIIPLKARAEVAASPCVADTIAGQSLLVIRRQMNMAAILWAIAAIVLYPNGTEPQKMLVAIAVMGAMASGAIALHAIPSVAGVFAAITVTGLLVALSLDGSPVVIPLSLLLAFLFTAIMTAVNEAGRVFVQNHIRSYEQEKSKELFSVLFQDFEDSASDWMWEVDENGRIVHVSPQFFLDARFQGYSFDGKSVGRLFREPESVVRGDPIPALQRKLLAAFARRAPFKDIVSAVEIGGQWRFWRLSGRPVLASNGRFAGMRGACSDVTESFEAENRLQYLAMHDAMTGLPNRENFGRAFDAALAKLHKGGGQLALLAIDLDKFKMVNDTLGHQAGDEMLRKVAERFRNLKEPDVVFARFGGDEFCAFISGKGAGMRAERLAQTIVDALAEPVEITAGMAEIGCSIGISVCPRDGMAAETLHRNADLALYRAKSMPNTAWCIFEPMMDATARKLQDLEYELRSALKREEFELYFQPLVDSGSRKTTCFETLLRWNSARFGRVPPTDFIRIAEKTGLIHEIGGWVIDQACREAARWPMKVPVAINLSPRQLEGVRLLDIVEQALAGSGLPASRLELEVTESALEAEPEHAAALLRRLRKIGVRIALDDFGTGYSSLSYLVRFPIDKLKIDKSFVQNAMCSEQNLAIVRAIVSLARSMKVRTTAEGVETEEQAAFLRLEGIDEFQGYLLGRPRPAAHMPANPACRMAGDHAG